MKNKVLSTINKYKLIEKGDNIVVGVSGGPDSMALLYVLLDIQKQIKFNIYIVHVNHGVRGIEADEDEEYVKNVSKQLNIPFYCKKIDMEGYAKRHKMSSEEAGRKLRYGFLKDTLSSIGKGRIAVAHNKNDQAETLLMRFLRGTGIDGLKGMEYKKDNIIRPLLDISRKEIEDYINQNHIYTKLDKTNLQPIYNRNKIRLQMIPYIKENFNSNIINTLSRTSKIMTVDSNFLEEFSFNAYNKIVKSEKKSSIILSRKVFLKYHLSIKQRVIRNCISTVNGNIQGFTQRHIFDVVKLFSENNTGKSINLIDNIVAKTSYDDLIIEKKKERVNIKFNYKLNINNFTYAKEYNHFFETKIVPIQKIKLNLKDRFIKYFDYDKIEGSLYIRNRLSGDKFIPFGMKGNKKLKDYFIDEKVCKEKRDEIPLVVDSKNIIWVVGYRVSDIYKITKNTKNILIIKYYKKL